MLDEKDLQQIKDLMDAQKSEILQQTQELMRAQKDEILQQTQELMRAQKDEVLHQAAQNTQVIIEKTIGSVAFVCTRSNTSEAFFIVSVRFSKPSVSF